jgi:hypothetical protein
VLKFYLFLGIIFVTATIIFSVLLQKVFPSGYHGKPGEIRCTNKRVYFSLSEALKEPDNVCIFHIHDHNLQHVPIEILKLQNLQSLHLHTPHLVEIPLFLQQLPHLTELVVDGYRFGDEKPELQKKFPNVIIYFDFSHKD